MLSFCFFCFESDFVLLLFDYNNLKMYTCSFSEILKFDTVPFLLTYLDLKNLTDLIQNFVGKIVNLYCVLHNINQTYVYDLIFNHLVNFTHSFLL